MPGVDKAGGGIVYGCGAAQTLGEGSPDVRRRPHSRECDEAGRQPEGRLARYLAAGREINTSATGFAPIGQLQMMRFKGQKRDLFGDIISGNATR